MNKLLFLVPFLVASSLMAQLNSDQSGPSFTVKSGTASVTTQPCNDPTNVGSIYTQLGNPSVTYVCNQTGAAVSGLNNGGGVFQWVADLTILNSCGSSATCASTTLITSPLKIAMGTVAMSSSTTATVSGIPAFTSATSFACSVSNANAHAYTSGVEITSATGITVVSGTSNSDTWIWQCIGY